MKFIVREGFVCNWTERSKQKVEGKDTTVEREYSQYPGDAAFEMSEEQARAHAHKLEGVDKEGKAFLQTLVRNPKDSVQDAGEPSVPLSQVQQMIDDAIAKAAASKPAV